MKEVEAQIARNEEAHRLPKPGTPVKRTVPQELIDAGTDLGSPAKAHHPRTRTCGESAGGEVVRMGEDGTLFQWDPDARTWVNVGRVRV